MRRLALVLAACGSPAHVVPTPTPKPVVTPDAAVAAVTPDGPPPVADPLAPIPNDDWDVEIVDHDIGPMEMVDLAWRNGPVIYADANFGVLRYAPGPRGWDATFTGGKSPLVVGHDSADHPWSVEFGGYVRNGRAEIETVLTQLDARSLAFDAHDVPIVCGKTDDKKRDVVVARRSGPKSKPWVVETLPMTGELCKLSPDGSVVGLWGQAGIAMATRTGKTWTSEPLSTTASGLAFATAPDGTLAAAFFDGKDLVIARRGASGWTKQPLVKNTTGTGYRISLAFDTTGKAHAVYMTSGNNGYHVVNYAAEGKDPAVVMDDAFITAVAIAMDPTNTPLFAVVGVRAGAHGSELWAVRPRGTSTLPRRYFNPLSERDACAALIEQQLGAPAGDRAVAAKHERDCGTYTPDFSQEDGACVGGDRSACEIAGALLVPPQGVGPIRVELRLPACKTKDKCFSRFVSVMDKLAPIEPIAHDAGAAGARFESACELGSKVACMEAATLRGGSFAAFAAACTPDLSIACAAAISVSLDGEAPTKKELEPIRAALDTACKVPARDACNVLAFLDETGYGGLAKRDATSTHLRACANGATGSCMALLLRTSRPAAPKNLDGAAMVDDLDGRCQAGDPDACKALATALDVGWGVTRDRARAKELQQR